MSAQFEVCINMYIRMCVCVCLCVCVCVSVCVCVFSPLLS